MQVTAKAEYAVRAVLQLATNPLGVSSRSDLAAAQQIPGKFLESILLSLRHAGLLSSIRGQHGGYRLAVPADQISLADVIRSVDGPLAGVRGLPPEDIAYEGAAEHLRDVWVALRAAMREVLEATTVADVLAGQLPEGVQRMLAAPDAWNRR